MDGWLALAILVGGSIGVKVLRKKGILPGEAPLQEVPPQGLQEVPQQGVLQEIPTPIEAEPPKWKGVYDNVGANIGGVGRFRISIAYPAIIPFETAFVEQLDGTAAFVSILGYDDTPEGVKPVSVNRVEDAFRASGKRIHAAMENYRRGSKRKYADFDFVVEKQELTTIKDMPACKYLGKHTYTKNGIAEEIPFAAYSFYTGQLENYSYFTVVVVDDHISKRSLEPLQEGVIEAYARKMVESVELKESRKYEQK